MKKSFLAALILCGLLFVRMPAAVSQEAEDDKFSFGKVVSVAADQITVKEYDFAKDADVEVVYSVSAETELGNVDAVSDLKADDDIVIDYVEKDGKRMVTTLVKEEKGAEVPEMVAEEMAAEAAPVEAAPMEAVPAEAAPAAAPAAEAAPAPAN